MHQSNIPVGTINFEIHLGFNIDWMHFLLMMWHYILCQTPKSFHLSHQSKDVATFDIGRLSLSLHRQSSSLVGLCTGAWTHYDVIIVSPERCFSHHPGPPATNMWLPPSLLELVYHAVHVATSPLHFQNEC
jgi:hypothetical protein